MTEPVIHDAMVEAVDDALGGIHPHTAKAILEDALRAARDLGATHIDLRSGELVTGERVGTRCEGEPTTSCGAPGPHYYEMPTPAGPFCNSDMVYRLVPIAEEK